MSEILDIIILYIILILLFILIALIIRVIISSFSSKKTVYVIDESKTMGNHYYEIAERESEKGNYKEAIENYDRAILENPQAMYYYNRAISKYKLSDYNGALEDCTKAVLLDPKNSLFLIDRGFLHLSNNNEHLAIIDWENAAKIGSKKAEELLLDFYTTEEEKVLIQEALKVKSASPIPPTIKLHQYYINYFYHMTHKDNIESILINGLLSYNKAHKGYNQIDISDNEVNSRRSKQEPIYNRSIHDYVPMYFNPKNPMLFRRKNMQNDIVILAIDKNILTEGNFLFTDGNAASNATKFFDSLNQLDELNWKCIHGKYWNEIQDGKRMKCAEVLIYLKIEVASIKKIFCNNLSTLNFINSKVKNINTLSVEINKNLYF